MTNGIGAHGCMRCVLDIIDAHKAEVWKSSMLVSQKARRWLGHLGRESFNVFVNGVPQVKIHGGISAEHQMFIRSILFAWRLCLSLLLTTTFSLCKYTMIVRATQNPCFDDELSNKRSICPIIKQSSFNASNFELNINVALTLLLTSGLRKNSNLYAAGSNRL